MKKITFLLSVMLIGISLLSNAQNCTPDHTGYTAVPDTGIMLPRPLPDAMIDVAYQQAVTIGVPIKVMYSGLEAPLNWIKFISATSSLGNTWNVVNNTGDTIFPQWDKATWQCVTLMGTPTHSGLDSISVMVDAEIVVFATNFPVSNQEGGKLALLVKIPQTVGAAYIDNNVSVYPNPSNDGIYSLVTDQSFTMNVCDITGKIILSEQIEEGNIAVNISDKPAGVYFIQLKNDYYSKVIRILKK